MPARFAGAKGQRPGQNTAPAQAIVFPRATFPVINSDCLLSCAPPGTTFRATLKNAFDLLLAVPVIEGDVALDPKVVSFAYGDERLEGLSEAKKQLLRMGPENAARIQAKIMELEAALGL